MARLKWTDDALLQLEELLAEIAVDDPEAAAAVADTIDNALRRLENFPESAPPYRAGVRRLSIPGLPVSCYYRYRGDTVRVLIVRHDKQKPLQ